MARLASAPVSPSSSAAGSRPLEGVRVLDFTRVLAGPHAGRMLLDLGAETMKFKQLAPLAKMNLAVVTTALEFLLLMYGALFVYAPRFNGVLRNVGK